MRKLVVTMFVCGVLLGATREAAAQAEWTDLGYVNLSWGVEKGDSILNDSLTRIIYDEPARITTASNWSSGSLFDVGLGLRVWRNLSVGGAYHQESDTSDVAIAGAIPHPLFFNKPRVLDKTEPALTRKEHAAHLVFGWMVPIGEKFDVLVSAGPSWFQLQQDVVSKIVIAEAGQPYTSLVTDVTVETRKRNQVLGYNVGADATYFVWTNDSVRFGIGGFFRYTAASTTVKLLTDSSQPEQPTDVGGLQFGFGGRLRF